MKNVKLGVICNIEIGRTPSRNQPKYWGNGYSWLSIADMKNFKFLSETKEQVTDLAIRECNMKLVPQGTLLFSFKLSVGKVGIASKDLFTNEAIAALKIKSEKEVYQPFLYHALGSLNFDGKGDRAVKGITLNKAKLRELLIPLPPLPAQKRIAEILDKADALRQKNKQLLATYDELLQSTFLDMFGDPVTNPKGWEIKKLKEFYIDQKNGTKCGPFGSALKKNEYKESGVPVWTMDNIKPNKFIEGENLFISEEKYNDLRGYKTQKGDIIISRAGTVGKMCIIPFTVAAIISTNLIRLRLNSKKLLPIYFTTIMSNWGPKLARLKTGGDNSFTHMNTGVLNEIELPIPPIALQNQFAQIVENIEAQKTLVKQSLHESEDLFNGLLQKAFGGEL